MLFSLIAWPGSTPLVFYFQLPAYPLTSSSLTCFGCRCRHHKFLDCFTILTFSPSSFRETSAFAFFLRGAAHCRITMTSADFCSLIIIDWQTSQGKFISFHSCSLRIYMPTFCVVSDFCFLCNIIHVSLPLCSFCS